MKQVVQNLRNGTIEVADVPEPVRATRHVLVANRASIISAGTERTSVKTASASLLGKARQRPDQVKQVLRSVKKEGAAATWKKVRDRLDRPGTLGYSAAGVVVEADADADLQPGDRVACAGAGYAIHAELISVPRNLVTRLPENVDFVAGCFSTLGAIALQSVRRAQVQIGDRVLVIGLGLVGQLVWQLARTAGCRVVGADISDQAVRLARQIGLDNAHVLSETDVEALCSEATDGRGMDSVVIAAATSSSQPMVLAGEVCRERGSVVVLGDVPMNVPRELYYRKEIDLLISRSYGPGRYDSSYEEQGIDYPYGFVRWTEGRNMQAFLEALSSGAVLVSPLVTHTFRIDEAPRAYALVSGEHDSKEPCVGIVFEYEAADSRSRSVAVTAPTQVASPDGLRFGFIGAGNFARSYLLPNILKQHGLNPATVVSSRGHLARDAATKFGFERASTDWREIIEDDEIDLVFVATRHDTHVEIASTALETGKHVFVEKPLALTSDELEMIQAAVAASGRILQVGFNRRFSPLATATAEILRQGQSECQIVYRINAGPLSPDHWLLDAKTGGGRLVGEVCHFVDLAQFLADSHVQRVCAMRFGPEEVGSTSMLLRHDDGSVSSLVYQANATEDLAKERIEAFSGGMGALIDDWRALEVLRPGRRSRKRFRRQEKGYAEEIDAFVRAVKAGTPAVAFESFANTTRAMFALDESIESGKAVDVR